jgi:hypothetical protein
VSLWMSARRCVECGANETLCNAPLPEAKTYPIDFMSIETIGEAHSLGWRVVARCAYSRGDGPSSKSSRECIYRKELDMETLVWTRGRAFPLSRLESAYGAHDAARGRLWCCSNHRQTSLQQNLDRRLSFCAGINKCANGAKRKVGSRRRQQ